jgi:hypothetical protein
VPIYKYFTWAFNFSALGLIGGAALGYAATGTVAGAVSTAFIVAVLGVLETSLSFDNAVVNASVLKDMEEKWRRRFLTWGILIAVFGMRVIFPLLIVAVAAGLDPIEAVRLAMFQPADYAAILTGAHVGIAGFGGAFLFMVGLKYFFDAEKAVHWIGGVERHLVRFARIESFGLALVLVVIYGISRFLGDHAMEFLVSGMLGLVAFVAVEGIGSFMEASDDQVTAVHRAGAASFVYLEVLDASFSFDGVIGAFALSSNLFVIAIGLGIGAFYVRSMTLMLVDRGTLAEYRYLEHGAFWAILCLAGIMFAQTLVEIPEAVTGLIGAALIGAALLSSIRHNRREALLAAPGRTEAAISSVAVKAATLPAARAVQRTA